VLDEADKRALLARSDHNFVAVDLPHVPPKAAGPARAYAAAAKTLAGWLDEGAMVRDPQPAFYVYHQSFRQGNVQYTRKMFVARLRLVEFGEGVFAHEETFGGPKEDRLALTRATRANMSPIFGLYEDAENRVATLFSGAIPVQPLAEGQLDATNNRLWAVTERSTLGEVASLMRDRPIYIADGHHRYGTAMLYREELDRQGALIDDHPANFVLCVLCAMEDPGLLIFPTHRVLRGLGNLTTERFEGDEQLAVEPLDVTAAEDVQEALAEHGPQAVAFYAAGERRFVSVAPADAGILDSICPERSAAWRRLGLSFLHHYLIDRVVAPACCEGKKPEISYVKSAGSAIDLAEQSKGAVFLMQPTTMEELRAVCSAGDLMPQKSTYFFPKLASGLVIHSLEA
jgi:uncharacterized protein (DUF1015 family)